MSHWAKNMTAKVEVQRLLFELSIIRIKTLSNDTTLLKYFNVCKEIKCIKITFHIQPSRHTDQLHTPCSLKRNKSHFGFRKICFTLPLGLQQNLILLYLI